MRGARTDASGTQVTKDDRLIASNKRAYHDYFVEETFEAGIALTGTEVKSLRQHGAQMRDSFAVIRRSEAWLHGVHISPYSHGNRANVDPDRIRKLLLHAKQIRYLGAKTKERGYTLVPLRIYFNERNIAKLELGLCRGKHTYDKRDSIAKRDQERDVQRALRERQKGE
ncbi:MAG: SsrA-binding protein SmpB [Actinobacteria bacterium]|nr:MAG: SsrA-binding protein SmpB [Actinomycetota bacterium]